MAFKLGIVQLPVNPRKIRIAIAAGISGVELEYPDFDFNTYDTEEYRATGNPVGRNPVLETPSGKLFESAAIVRFIGRQGKDVYGGCAYQAGLVDSWIEFATNELERHVYGQFFVHAFGGEKNEAEAATQLAAVNEAFTALNPRLEGKTYLVGDKITIADVSVAAAVDTALRYQKNAELFSKYPNVVKHYTTVWNTEAAQAALKSIGNDGKIAEAPQ